MHPGQRITSTRWSLALGQQLHTRGNGAFVGTSWELSLWPVGIYGTRQIGPTPWHNELHDEYVMRLGCDLCDSSPGPAVPLPKDDSPTHNLVKVCGVLENTRGHQRESVAQEFPSLLPSDGADKQTKRRDQTKNSRLLAWSLLLGFVLSQMEWAVHLLGWLTWRTT
jgi:hypothetical protein